MRNVKILGPNVALMLSYNELPIGSTQIGPDPNLMKTGTWRFVRPVIEPKMPPCAEACPAAVDIRGFIKLINDGLVEEARESYLEENPFPAILGRVCFHPCEAACNRGDYDEAVSINGLENYIGDSTIRKPFCLDGNGKNIAIIGSGPSGLACAYFLKRLGYSIKMFEKEMNSGGILRYGIPAYRLPKQILDKEINQLTSMGVEIQTDRELGRNLNFGELKTFNAVYIATGAHSSVSSDMSGMEAEGVYYGLDFLKKVAVGETKVFEKRTIVIGGGNTAIDVARTILRLIGKPIIYYRRSREEMPAIKDEIADCEREGIEIHPLTAPVKILSKQNKVTGVEFIRNELGAPDKNGRPAPVPVKGTNFQVNAEAVVLAIGEQADLSLFAGALKAEGQLIKINELGQSSDPKIFAGGDVAHYQRTVVDAIRAGKQAAIGIDCYLQGLNEKEAHRILQSITTNRKGALSFKKYIRKDFASPDTEVIHYENLNTSYFQHEKRNERRELPAETRIKNFKEVRGRFSSKVSQKEAERCFSCGLCNLCGNCFILCPDGSAYFDENKPTIQIDYDYCKGCGICREECPRGAIRMVQEE